MVSADGTPDAVTGFVEREGDLLLLEVPGGAESGDASSDDGYACHGLFVLIRSGEQNIFLMEVRCGLLRDCRRIGFVG